jgi:hypothetical protein
MLLRTWLLSITSTLFSSAKSPHPPLSGQQDIKSQNTTASIWFLHEFLIRTILLPAQCQATKQLKLHSLRSSWATKDLPYHIRARRKGSLEDRFAITPHISQDSLAEMPAQKLVSGPRGVLQKPVIKIRSSDINHILHKGDDLIIILQGKRGQLPQADIAGRKGIHQGLSQYSSYRKVHGYRSATISHSVPS